MSAPALRLVRFQAEHQEAILTLHHSAMSRFTVGMSATEEEADLRDIETAYLRGGGEFLVGLLDGQVMAMGGFRCLSTDTAELKRMRIRSDLQGKGYGTQLLHELERLAAARHIQTLCLETAKARPLTLQFYCKHGYQESGEGLYGQVATVRFTKQIATDNRLM
jgi:GNAT superfamily N-acetyltransferase